eukprot:11261260-Prorocentrum_lima.AAC.1
MAGNDTRALCWRFFFGFDIRWFQNLWKGHLALLWDEWRPCMGDATTGACCTMTTMHACGTLKHKGTHASLWKRC